MMKCKKYGIEIDRECHVFCDNEKTCKTETIENVKPKDWYPEPI
jgi:hypothetical protein